VLYSASPPSRKRLPRARGRIARRHVPNPASPEARRPRGEHPQAGRPALPVLDAPDERGHHPLLPRVGPPELRPDLRPPDLVHAGELPHGGADRGGRRPLRPEGLGRVRRLPARRGLGPLRDLPSPRGLRRRRGRLRRGARAHLGRRRGARLRLAPRARARGGGVPGHGPPGGGQAGGDPRGGAPRRRRGLAVRSALAHAPPGRAHGALGALRSHSDGTAAREEGGRRRATSVSSPAGFTTSARPRSCARSPSTRSRAPPSPGS
jgi:hypothetical protein